MKNVLEFLEKTAEKYSDRAAVEDENMCFKWKDLKKISQGIGTFLCKECTAGKPVAIMAEKSPFTMAAMLGTVYAGCFYVIIDPCLPSGRMQDILDVLEPEVMILQDDRNKKKILNIGYKGRTVLFSEILHMEICFQELDIRRKNSRETDILYGIFTSGSTGKPKCVAVSHRAVIDFITHFTKLFGISETDRIGNQAPFDFDVSVKDIYSCLATGAELVLIPKMFFSLPARLLDYLCLKKITVLIWAASALGMVAALKGLEYKVPHEVRKVFFSGEVMPVKLLKKWQTALPEAEFVNLYGPTEITCNCTYYPVKRIFHEDEKIPAGQILPGRKIFLLDAEKNVIQAPDKKGEICVAGESLAEGYYHNEEETDRHFKYLFIEGKKRRCYLTGDIGYFGTNKELYFSGRKDFQIKHMGHRIELEEIELKIEQVEDVQNCCCIIDSKKNRLAAFYSGAAEQKNIRDYLKANLPGYMIPHIIQKTDRIPLNKNGKRDRNYLRQELEVGRC